MYSGSFAFRKLRRSLIEGAAPGWNDIGHQALVSGDILPGQHHASCTAGCWPNTDSISPSSMRKPRIFTWWSSAAQELDIPSGR